MNEMKLMRENLKKHLMRIQDTPGVEFEQITPAKYYISYKSREWFVWPKSRKYIQISNNKPITEMYWGDIKSFYHRYIAETNNLPKNHGKFWTENDISILIDMLENEASINEISEALERHPQTIIDRLQLTFNNEIDFLQISIDQWDFIISDLIDLYP